MPKFALGLLGLQDWFDGDFSQVLGLAQRAEAKGIDEVLITDHVVMGEALEKYPYGPFPVPSDYPWYEPITALAAIAGATKRIRLATGILIAPLRPAPLLAKQIATLDVISKGRVEIGFGVGWQKEEYESSNLPWEGRFDHMFEQVKACRELWANAPASFHGPTINFDRIYSRPRPVQQDLPIWFGIAPTDANFEKIAIHGAGWQPMERDPAKIKDMVERLRAAFRKQGRDPGTVGVRAALITRFKADRSGPDLPATLAQIPALLDAGVTAITILPAYSCKTIDEYDGFLDAVIKATRP
jgi:probable F420-dependent oxidoreductase